MDLNKFVKDLEKVEEELEKIAKAAKAVRNEMMQDENDARTVLLTIQKRREELALIERDIQTRVPQQQAGIDRLNKELYLKLAKADEKIKIIDKLKEQAAKDRDIAAALRQEAEGIKREMTAVAGSVARQKPQPRPRMVSKK